MPRVPMLAGSRLVVVSADDEATVLRPPPPGDGVADVRAAVRDALRVPLAGAPLEALVPRTGGRAGEAAVPGGPAALLAAASREALRSAGAWSLLETSASQGWRTALALERLLAGRVPVIGASLVLNLPRAGGAARGYPYEDEALERIAGSPLRHLFGVLPGAIRASILRSLPLERTVAAAFAGPPSVAHAEALLRRVELRRAVLDGELDAICIGLPRTTPTLPRERPNPLLVSYLGLGLALRLWRDRFPL